MARGSLDDARHWLKRAEEARERAEQMHSPEARLQMLEIAEGYVRMAKRAVDRAAPAAGKEPSGR